MGIEALAKDLAKSKNEHNYFCFASKFITTEFIKSRIASEIDLLDLNPNCDGESRLYFSRQSTSLLFVILSKTFYNTGKTAIGSRFDDLCLDTYGVDVLLIFLKSLGKMPAVRPRLQIN